MLTTRIKSQLLLLFFFRLALASIQKLYLFISFETVLKLSQIDNHKINKV